MNKITLNIPENVNLTNFDLTVYVAAKMYEDGLVTAGQASEIVGISKRAFIEILGKYGVSLFSQAPDDMEKDIDKTGISGAYINCLKNSKFENWNQQ
jgi:predicted HTH domain antitoxin